MPGGFSEPVPAMHHSAVMHPVMPMDPSVVHTVTHHMMTAHLMPAVKVCLLDQVGFSEAHRGLRRWHRGRLGQARETSESSCDNNGRKGDSHAYAPIRLNVEAFGTTFERHKGSGCTDRRTEHIRTA